MRYFRQEEGTANKHPLGPAAHAIVLRLNCYLSIVKIVMIVIEI